jgi:hypothetical protein
MANCPVCATPNATHLEPTPNVHRVDCPACGKFITNDETLDLISARITKSPYVRSMLMHSIRRMQNSKELPFIDAPLVRQVMSSLPSSLREQTDRLVILLGDELRLADPSDFTKITPWDFAALLARIGVYNEPTFWLIVSRLGAQHLLDFRRETYEFRFSLELWDRYEMLRKSEPETRLAFMAMAFNETDVEEMYTQYFKPAVAATGFDLRTLAEGQRAGVIDDQLRVEIRRSRFLVSDLSHSNQGAYWEAGFAEGIGKPVIYTCETTVFNHKDKTRRPHFDTNHCLTVVWDKSRPQEAVDKLKATIRATIPGEAKMGDD